MKITKRYLNELQYAVTGAAIYVHKELGPGLLESVYHKCMKHELAHRGLHFQSELRIPITFRNQELEADLRLDLWVENILPVELKAVDQIHPLHEAQILSYLKLLAAPKGLLINFHCSNIYRDGQRSYLSELYRDLAA